MQSWPCEGGQESPDCVQSRKACQGFKFLKRPLCNLSRALHRKGVGQAGGTLMGDKNEPGTRGETDWGL